MSNSLFHRTTVEKSLSVSTGKKFAKHPIVFRVIGLVALAYSTVYLIYRIMYTNVGVNQGLFWLLFGAEFIGWLSFALFVRDTFKAKYDVIQDPALMAAVDVLIPTFDENRDILLPTLIGATRLHGQKKIWVLDDGNREWVAQLAKLFGAEYVAREDHSHAKAGNLNNVLPLLKNEYLLVLDADHVVMPQFVEKTIGYFTDPKVAVVQTPHGFRNRDSAQHIDQRVNEQSLFFDVLLPGRQDSQATFWCGSGALLRRSALLEVGGIATETITEDLETSLELMQKGFYTVYHNEILLQGLAPQNLSAFLIQRYRWARGSLQILLGKHSPIFSKGFKFKTRISFLSNLVYYITPLQHLAFVAVLAWTFLSAQLPLSANIEFFMYLWLPQMALSVLAIWGLARGTQRPLGGSKTAWMTSSVHIGALIDTILGRRTSFKVTPKEGVDIGGRQSAKLLWLPIASAMALVASAVYQIILHFDGSAENNELPQLALVLGLGFIFFELIVLIPLVVELVSRKQMRQLWRQEVNLDAQVGGLAAIAIDLNQHGVQLLTGAVGDLDISAGAELPIAIDCELLDGQRIWAKGTLKLNRGATADALGQVRLSGPVEWASEASELAILEYLFVVEPSRRVLT